MADPARVRTSAPSAQRRVANRLFMAADTNSVHRKCGGSAIQKQGCALENQSVSPIMQRRHERARVFPSRGSNESLGWTSGKWDEVN